MTGHWNLCNIKKIWPVVFYISIYFLSIFNNIIKGTSVPTA